MPRTNTRKNPVLYIVKQEPDGPFKVGISHNPTFRLSQMQTCNPNELKLMDIINPGEFCAKTIESKVHRILSKNRIRGEWFDTTLQNIREAIGQAKKDTDKRYVRRISVKQATPAWCDKQKISDLEIDARRLSAMSGFNYKMDYIIPREHHLVCGLHTHDNMRIVSNAQYGKYHEEDWLSIRRPHSDPHHMILSIKNSSSRYDALIARDPELTRWVLEQSKKTPTIPFKQRIHIALTGEEPFCQYGKLRKFRAGKHGWCNLGQACRCKHEDKFVRKVPRGT